MGQLLDRKFSHKVKHILWSWHLVIPSFLFADTHNSTIDFLFFSCALMWALYVVNALLPYNIHYHIYLCYNKRIRVSCMITIMITMDEFYFQICVRYRTCVVKRKFCGFFNVFLELYDSSFHLATLPGKHGHKRGQMLYWTKTQEIVAYLLWLYLYNVIMENNSLGTIHFLVPFIY